MKTDSNNRLITILVGILVVVVAVQSVVMAKLYQRINPPENPAVGRDPITLQSSSGGTPSSGSSPNPSTSFGGSWFGSGVWDPFSELHRMRQQMDQMFNDSFGRFRMNPDFESLWGVTSFSPSMDLEEKKDSYVVSMDIPGADKSDISVSIKDRTLEVSGTVDETVEEQGQHQLRKERRSGRFNRSMMLPGPVKDAEMEAKYKDGVLIITVPKAEGGDEPHSIEVQ